MRPLFVVILAAGQGKRIRSTLPKVLHQLAGRALLEHVVCAARILSPEEIHVVYGYGGERVRESLAHLGVHWVVQRQQLGTGHAVAQAMPVIPDEARVLVLYGDVPLVEPASLSALCDQVAEGSLGLMTVRLPDPTGYGRVLRDEQGRVMGSVEERDASEAQRKLNEVNTGILAAHAGQLRGWLASLKDDNEQGEFYLPDVIARAVTQGVKVRTVVPRAPEEVLGVNDRCQLAHLERYYQSREAQRLMQDGVTLRDPARLDIRGTVTVGVDVTIDVNVLLIGEVVIGDGVAIGPNTVIRDSHIGDGTEILANSVIEQAHVGVRCQIGPFARLRPEAQLAEQVHIGNFVEIKKSTISSGSKVNHLSYVGDSHIGAQVNVGAGTITCNYDGANKHRTVIGDGAFIGSGTELVAPVTVGSGATIGAGSTITKDAPADALTLERSRQLTLSHWRRPTKGSDKI
jgi:bifunctional UDP-N-acetylglucosamine pyrophosphorylase/glucosamine-1-phosphate N-acetyltransferase